MTLVLQIRPIYLLKIDKNEITQREHLIICFSCRVVLSNFGMSSGPHSHPLKKKFVDVLYECKKFHSISEHSHKKRRLKAETLIEKQAENRHTN